MKHLILIFLFLFVEVNAECGSKPSDATDMASGTQKESSIYYGCNAEIKSRFGEEWCVFNVYHCTFKSIKSSAENGGALYITNKKKGASGNILIYESTFEECEANNGGAIYIQTSQYVRFYNITKCIFKNDRAIKSSTTKATEAIEGFGGAIYFEAAYGVIEECEFNNNKADQGNDILYNDNAQKSHEEKELKIMNNKFIRNEEETIKSSMIYVHIEANSRFTFSNNEIISTQGSNDVALFDNADGAATGGAWTFSSNCISSSKIKISSTDDLNNIIPTNSFTTCSNKPSTPSTPTKPTTQITPTTQPSEPTSQTTATPTIEPPTSINPTNAPEVYCGSKPSDATDMATGTQKESSIYYGCNAEIKSRFGEEWCVFNVYHCTFKSIKSSAENGGALYITNKKKGASGNILIYESTFEECEANNGGAIYIQTSQYVRFYNITKCIFKNDRAIKSSTTKATEVIEGFGGAIYFEAAYGVIEECEFNNNKANQGNDILYNDNAQNAHEEKELKIMNNKFIRNEEETIKSSMIYVHIEANSRFTFSNNEIISTQGSNDVALFDNADEAATGGVWTFSSNCISSSNIKISSTDDLNNIIPANSFTTCSNKPSTPSTPTKPTTQITPTQEQSDVEEVTNEPSFTSTPLFDDLTVDDSLDFIGETIEFTKNSYKANEKEVSLANKNSSIILINSQEDASIIKISSNMDKPEKTSFVSPHNENTKVIVLAPSNGSDDYGDGEVGVHANSNLKNVVLQTEKVPLNIYNNETSEVLINLEKPTKEPRISLNNLIINNGSIQMKVQDEIDTIGFNIVEVYKIDSLKSTKNDETIETKIDELRLKPGSQLTLSTTSITTVIKSSPRSKLIVEGKAVFNNEAVIQLTESSMIDFGSSIIEGIINEIKLSEKEVDPNHLQGENSIPLICGSNFNCSSWQDKFVGNNDYLAAKCVSQNNQVCLTAINKPSASNKGKKPLGAGAIAGIVIVVVAVVAVAIVLVILFLRRKRNYNNAGSNEAEEGTENSVSGNSATGNHSLETMNSTNEFTNVLFNPNDNPNDSLKMHISDDPFLREFEESNK